MGPFFSTLLAPNAARAYADGAMTPDEANSFLFAYNKLVGDAAPKTVMSKDDLGRDVSYKTPGYSIPSFLTEAIAQGNQINTLSSRSEVPPTRGTVSLGPDVTADIDNASRGTPVAVRADDTAKSDAPRVNPPRQLTLHEMADTLVFTEAAKGMIARNVPLAGNMAAQSQVNQNYFNNLRRELTRIMQNSPRFAEGERTAIQEELGMGVKINQDANALRNSFLGVDRFLAEKVDQARIDYANKDLVPEIRKAAQEDIRSITAFREKLMPPRLYNTDDIAKLPLGAVFFWRNEENYRTRENTGK